MKYYCDHGFVRDSETIDYSGRCETCTTIKIESLEAEIEKAVDTMELAFNFPEKHFRTTMKAVLKTLKGE